jgi:hypothetical protein
MKRAPYELTPGVEAALRAVAIRLRTWNVVTLQLQADVSALAAKRAVAVWKEAGLIRPNGRSATDLPRWLWVGEDGSLPDETRGGGGTKHGNLWRSMRLLKEFSPTDLMAMSSTDLIPVNLQDARIYCQLLLKAEYLRVREKAITGRREASYRLIRDTGYLPPVERRLRAVIDQNDGKVSYLDGGIA